jgi:hypothetical protein
MLVLGGCGWELVVVVVVVVVAVVVGDADEGSVEVVAG